MTPIDTSSKYHPGATPPKEPFTIAKRRRTFFPACGVRSSAGGVHIERYAAAATEVGLHGRLFRSADEFPAQLAALGMTL